MELASKYQCSEGTFGYHMNKKVEMFFETLVRQSSRVQSVTALLGRDSHVNIRSPRLNGTYLLHLLNTSMKSRVNKTI
jgi:hypothetical protein